MADEFKVGDPILYRVRDDLWLPGVVHKITPRRHVIKLQGYETHRNTTASQLRHAPKPEDQQKG